jgi:hypothetical protein
MQDNSWEATFFPGGGERACRVVGLGHLNNRCRCVIETPMQRRTVRRHGYKHGRVVLGDAVNSIDDRIDVRVGRNGVDPDRWRLCCTRAS